MFDGLSGTWVNTPIGKVFVPHGWKIHISKPFIHRIKRWGGKINGWFTISYSVRVFEPFHRLKKWKARKSKHHFRITTMGSRYREKDLTQGTFLRGKRDLRIMAQTVLGAMRLYTNNVLTSGPGNIVAGGDLSPSLELVKTWDFVHPGPPYRGGGPFKSIQYHLPASKKVGYGRYTNQGRTSNTGNYCEYVGSFVDDGSWLGESYSTISAKGLSSFPSLSPYHTAAWDQLKPKLSPGNLAQFIYELKDLPGQLKTTAELFHLKWADISARSASKGRFVPLPYMTPKEASDQFLNEEFGWKPFLSDIVKLYDVFNHTGDYIAKITRDNGQWVRKRRVLEESDVTSPVASVGVESATIPASSFRSLDGFPMCNLMNTPAGSARGFCVQSTRDIKRVWAVGSFKYYRDEFDVPIDQNSVDLVNSVRRLMTVYGFRINPTLLYKIYPWTWAVDWFTGLGRHIERLDDFVQDGIVSKGLYVMSTTEKIMTKTSVLNFWSGQVTLNFQRRYSFKQRELADSPYGFNVPWNQMTPRQWAILGAIGISRSGSGYISRGA